LCRASEREPMLQSRVEESYQRIKTLKTDYLKSFRGIDENLLTDPIGTTSHRKLAEEITKAL